MKEYFTRKEKPLGGYKKMSKEEGLRELAKVFHRARFTENIHVKPEIIAAVLGYNNGERE